MTQNGVRDRLMARVEWSEDGCWLWTGATTTGGYGEIGVGNGRQVYTHRLAYETFVGPIPTGLVLDHVCHSVSTDCPGGNACRHRRCLNPAHLEPVTSAENVRRGARLINKCAKGHDYTPENTEWTKHGHRRCRACHRAGMRALYRPRPRKASPEVLQRIADLQTQGHSQSAIAKAVGLSQPYVSRLLKRIT